MSITEQSRFSKKRFIPLAIYTGVLCLSAQAYGFLAEHELFMQTLNTLFPLIALVGLLVLSIASALLLLSPAPLWLLLLCHLLIGCWWSLSFYFQTAAELRSVNDLLSGYSLAFLVACLLPPLLGWALLAHRWRKQQKARAAQAASDSELSFKNTAELSFKSAAELLGKADSADNTNSQTNHD